MTPPIEGALFHQGDVIAGVGQIECSLNTGDYRRR